MGLLTQLTIPQYNQLSGTVPTEMGHLTQLQYLGLVRNQLRHAAYRRPPHAARLSVPLGQFSGGTLPTEFNLLINLINPGSCLLTTTQCLAYDVPASTCGGTADINAFSCPVPTLPASCAASLGLASRHERHRLQCRRSHRQCRQCRHPTP